MAWKLSILSPVVSSSTLITEASMSRRTHSLLALVLVLVALTAACAESMAPDTSSELRADQMCDRTSNGTCL